MCKIEWSRGEKCKCERICKTWLSSEIITRKGRKIVSWDCLKLWERLTTVNIKTLRALLKNHDLRKRLLACLRVCSILAPDFNYQISHSMYLWFRMDDLSPSHSLCTSYSHLSDPSIPHLYDLISCRPFFLIVSDCCCLGLSLWILAEMLKTWSARLSLLGKSWKILTALT